MKKFYLSKNYIGMNSAGNKAKTDIEDILSDAGYCCSGLSRTSSGNKAVGFFLTLLSVFLTPFRLSKGDILVLQYPLKKYYTLVCRLAHMRGCKVVTIIHDLGSFRRKKLTVRQEIEKLSHTDYLIVHNKKMESWLCEKGYTKPMGCLQIFDYLSDSLPPLRADYTEKDYIVNYAGGLYYHKNRFLYEIDNLIQTWHLDLYGNGFEIDRILHKQHFTYKGFIPSDQLILSVRGHFGLVWDGESTDTCSGAFGEYLYYNNPHKTSLYIRCHLPVIIWKKAALASFVEENQIGITINSLSELNTVLQEISPQEYQRMKQNTVTISNRLARGYYLKQAIGKAEEYLI